MIVYSVTNIYFHDNQELVQTVDRIKNIVSIYIYICIQTANLVSTCLGKHLRVSIASRGGRGRRARVFRCLYYFKSHPYLLSIYDIICHNYSSNIFCNWNHILSNGYTRSKKGLPNFLDLTYFKKCPIACRTCLFTSGVKKL